jgi:hypothetical protein
MRPLHYEIEQALRHLMSRHLDANTASDHPAPGDELTGVKTAAFCCNTSSIIRASVVNAIARGRGCQRLAS